MKEEDIHTAEALIMSLVSWYDLALMFCPSLPFLCPMPDTQWVSNKMTFILYPLLSELNRSTTQMPPSPLKPEIFITFPFICHIIFSNLFSGYFNIY